MSKTENRGIPGRVPSSERTPLPERIPAISNPCPERRESDAQFRELMAHLVQVFWMDGKDGGVLYISPAYESIWGRPSEDLLAGRHALFDLVHADDRRRVSAAVAAQRQGHGLDEEFRIVRPDGETRWIWARTYPVRDDLGVVARFAGIADDITARRLEVQGHNRLATILEHSGGIIESINLKGTITGWNQAAERQYGYASADVLGKPISMLFAPDQTAEYTRLMSSVRKGERLASYDTTRQRKDGSLTHVSVSVVPIRALDGELIGASVLGHDITERKTMESQLIAAQKREIVGRMASGVAHDFNNILAVIIGFADLLLVALPPGEGPRDDVEEIRRAGERGAGLTRQLLAFSRNQSAQSVVLDLNDVVRGLDGILRQLVGDGIELTVDCDERIGRVKADVGQLGQVLMNLVANARDAMPDGGKLRVATSARAVGPNDAIQRAPRSHTADDYVVLSVIDTGTGIPDDVREHLFEPFFSTKPSTRGTGLGLSTCQTIVAQSGGFIDLISTLGKGTTFSVYLPCVDDVIAEAVAAPAVHEAAPAGGNETVLVVEDDVSVRRLACTVLRARGYNVLSAGDGQEGLSVVRQHQGPPIRLVVTDVVMPVMGGRTMVAWLQTSLPSLRVLFTSGYTDDTIAELGVLNEGVEFLAKPYTPTTLTKKVREMLETVEQGAD
jgi:two-component system, cell cycle sensor histidine kinase and response regulator CckA